MGVQGSEAGEPSVCPPGVPSRGPGCPAVVDVFPRPAPDGPRPPPPLGEGKSLGSNHPLAATTDRPPP
ncbi:hypothetical protein GCM10010249_56890 [Streptomyces roseolilacinus]|uniref:Uncharacterized protein n=1 Tax=Streptomyces roseolilacinus TaxID=66904 RepID=A0A918B5L4_9ACTN|nr:hypothetical protein GCM10010249_56890 [Streptomyces roseolilacinus]